VARDLLKDVRTIVRQMTGLGLIKTALLAGRRTGDSFADPVRVPAFRQPQAAAQGSGLPETNASWTLFADDGQEETLKPDPLDKFTVEETGEVWHVTAGRWSYGDLVYECDCTLEV
jgi:hypothetical protein